ncbi:hypothetical protein Anapl_09742 [Anas platyrhynchos]|uniref:Uncharacterized protein n=1 Tax=Anas platyrhynchos TaxID=8839 RepID=R0J9I6_ANAPL|nr:hypothetical protein Anapl_09742 [Anas platyrhynchos]
MGKQLHVQAHLKLIAQIPPKTSTEPSNGESWIFQSQLWAVRAGSCPSSRLLLVSRGAAVTRPFPSGQRGTPHRLLCHVSYQGAVEQRPEMSYHMGQSSAPQDEAEEEEKEEEEQELGNALQEAVQWEQESHRRGRAGAALQAAFSCQARKANALPCCPRPVTAHSSEAQPAPKFALLCLHVCSLDGNPWQPLPSGARVLLGAVALQARLLCSVSALPVLLAPSQQDPAHVCQACGQEGCCHHVTAMVPRGFFSLALSFWKGSQPFGEAHMSTAGRNDPCFSDYPFVVQDFLNEGEKQRVKRELFSLKWKSLTDDYLQSYDPFQLNASSACRGDPCANHPAGPFVLRGGRPSGGSSHCGGAAGALTGGCLPGPVLVRLKAGFGTANLRVSAGQQSSFPLKLNARKDELRSTNTEHFGQLLRLLE